MLSALANISHLAYASVSGKKIKQRDINNAFDTLSIYSKMVSSKVKSTTRSVGTNMILSKGAIDAFIKKPSLGEPTSEIAIYISQQSGLYTDHNIKAHIFMDVSSDSIPKLYSDIFKLHNELSKDNLSEKTQLHSLMSLSTSLERRIKKITNELRKACMLQDSSKSVATISNIAKLNAIHSEFNATMSKFWQGRSLDVKQAITSLSIIENITVELWRISNSTIAESLENREKVVITECKFYTGIFVTTFIIILIFAIITIYTLTSAAKRSARLSAYSAESDFLELRDYFENTSSRILPFTEIDNNIIKTAELLSETTDAVKKVLVSAKKMNDDASAIVSTQKPRLNNVTNSLLRIDAKILLRDKSDISLATSAQNLRDKVNVLEQNIRLQKKSVSDVSSDISSTSELAKKLTTSLLAVRDTADKMSVIAETFTALADQANILGLNLSIETAKAGIKGSGLGTLAEQIKILSKRTVVSVLDIESIRDLIIETIDKHSDDVENFVSSLKSDTKILNEIEQNLNELIVSLSKVSASANTMSISLRERGTSDMSVTDAQENLTKVGESLSDFALFTKSAAQEISNLRSKI